MHDAWSRMEAYKNKNKLGLVGCHFPWEKMTNVINEYTYA